MKGSLEIGTPIHGLFQYLPSGQNTSRLLEAYFKGAFHLETLSEQKLGVVKLAWKVFSGWVLDSLVLWILVQC